MRPAIQKRLLIFCLVVYLLVMSFSVTCMVLKPDKLSYNTRDYLNFIGQAAR